VRRSQIPREVVSLSENDPRFLSADHYFRPADLRLGEYISILNRDMFLYDCDEFTRKWYKQNMGCTDDELRPLPPPEREARQAVRVNVPPPVLIGSEEDQLQNCLSLHPRPPPKDEVKLVTRMHDVLRFRARMITRSPVDATRAFIVTFFLSDDTVQIYEPPVRNSGIIGGKFLQRMRVKNPETGDYFRPQDLEVGRIVTVNRQRFQLIEATEYAMSYMEADPETFPQADLSQIVERLRFAIGRSGRSAREVFAMFGDHGRMDIDGLLRLFKGVGYEITLHEALTVMRRYQNNPDEQTFTLREFLSFAG
jgi:hypothetical protein